MPKYDSSKVAIKIGNVWLTEDRVKVLELLAKHGSWGRVWEEYDKGRSGAIEDKLRVLNAVLGFALWETRGAKMYVNKENIMKIVNAYRRIKKIVEELERDLRP